MSAPTPARQGIEAPRFLRVPGGCALPGVAPGGLGRLIEVADRGGLQLAQARRLELIHRGDDHFDRLVAACALARHEICLEMYQIRRDPVGRRIASALTDAVRRGVSVRMLIDPIGSSRIADWLPRLRRLGVDARWYSPWRPWNHPLRRSHRKLAVFDGRSATVGGINIAGEFSEACSGDSAWRDVGLWVEGPVVNLLRRQFESAWAWEGRGPAGPVLEVERGADGLVAIAGGRDGRSGHGAAYIAMADAARTQLLLATPYFIPDRPFRAALKRAARRGVRVVVVVPRLCDIAWFKHAGRRLYGGLLRAGLEIRERSDRMVHAKVAVIDDCLAAVGSVNLNRRSFHGNAETLLLSPDHRVVGEIRHLIATEAGAAAEPLTPMRWTSHPDRRRLAELFAAPVGLMF